MAKKEMKQKKGTPLQENKNGEWMKVYHSIPVTQEREISPVFSTIDTDLARDNLENDITAADLQDL